MFRIVAGLLASGSVLAVVATLIPDNYFLDCSGGGRSCPPEVELESGTKKLALYDARALRAPAPGQLRAAYEQKQALTAAKDSVRGAGGRWSEHGQGPLISSGLAQTLGADLGVAVPDINLNRWAGRVDDFAYDPIGKRLFAAVSTGGIWMSETVNGDITTLGEFWRPVGDNLPYLATGGVIWTQGGGGTLIAATGDSVMSTGAYHGIGAFWSNDLGLTWNRSEGFPDDAVVFNTDIDRSNPNIAYIASSLGLFRTQDAGRSFQNVALPVSAECAGVEDRASACNLASVVSDVRVQAPGGTTNVQCSSNGCPVLAAVGWRAGTLEYPGTEIPQSPRNGMYKSATGEAGTFVHLDLPVVDSTTKQGFAPADRIGRIEMGNAIGAAQDHNYVYAFVQDASFLNGLGTDPQEDVIPTVLGGMIHGLYVSPDFGESWIQMADSGEIGSIPGPLVALVSPGVQSWYNQFIRPDPTMADPVTGIPTRLIFGLEEIFQNALPVPLDGTTQALNAVQDFQNIGYYFSAGGENTPHPDQHAAMFVEDDLIPGRVCLFAGNDGGISKQCVLPGQPFSQAGWGRGAGANAGFYTLLPYGLGVAKDGTVWFGLQDNGSGHMEPDTGESFGDFGADGFYAEVDPDNSDIAYTESQNGGLRRTTDRGNSATTIAPPYTRVNFANWFSMDPLNAEHMITLANEVYETTQASTVTGSTWTEVFRLGVNANNRAIYTATVGDVHGPAIYVGACGDCGVTNNDEPFQNRVATNVGGTLPPKPETSNGWHIATAAGLPNRLITAIEIDPDNAETVYFGLGNYSSGLRGPHTFGEDPNNDANLEAGYLFRSDDAGESFYSIQGDLPHLPINYVLVRDGQLLAATDFGVFISTDLQGTNWAPLGTGLPAAPVTQVKVQPGNPNKLFASVYGRHIWTYEFPADARVVDVPRSDSAVRGGAPGWLWLLVLLTAAVGRRKGIRH